MPLARRQIKRYGWRPSPPDAGRRRFSAERQVRTAASLPPSVDWTPNFGPIPVYDQGELGSCTANALAGSFNFVMWAGGNLGHYTPSRLFIYYNERAIEGTTGTDAGASLADGVKTLEQLGAPPEADWPYQIDEFTAKPPVQSYADALAHKVTDALSIDNTNILEPKTSISQGRPVVAGFTVYESFESDAVAASGVVPMPSPGEQILGGHAVLVVGYDDARQVFICRNSWGLDWGMGGYFTIPYAYFVDPSLASDFWAINAVS